MEGSFSDRIMEAAARWYARLHAADCSQAEREEFERWRLRDPAHAKAYAAAEAVVAGVAHLASADSRLRALADEAFAAGPLAAAGTRTRARHWQVATALAATMAAAVLGVAVFLDHSTERPSAAPVQASTADATHALTLEDGTVARLDVHSEVEWRFTARERQVVLRHGRAIFDVAHDAARPFTVIAGASRVTALGTRFQVEHTTNEVVVTLAAGAVSVSESSGAPRSERLLPGEELRIAAGSALWERRSVDARAATSWSTGRHMFRAMPLADALDEVNRYAAVKVRLADSSLSDLPVSGTFLTGDSRVIVAAFAAVLPLQIGSESGELVLYRRAPNKNN